LVKKKKAPPAGVCGCSCKACYCNEGACGQHPHCLGLRCSPEKLFHDLTGGNLKTFRTFVGGRFNDSPRLIMRDLITVFAKYSGLK
jgi:hypothetical protein